MRPRPSGPSPQRAVFQTRRRGTVLIIVLVLIMLLTLAVYGFTERMLTENKAAVFHGTHSQALASAASGIEYAAAVISSRAADPANPISVYHRPDLFAGQVMYESASAMAMGRFSLVAPVEGSDTASTLRFGLSDESGKLNLNALLSWDLDEEQQALVLMALPGVTEDLADAILDYIDSDEEPRLFGAESDYYQSISALAFAKNAPLESIDELLMVRGMTPEILFGEDANRNGLLDPSEDDGPASLPIDNADGVLQVGLAQYLTIHSQESNARLDGAPKIAINQEMLVDLYDEIVEVVGDEDMARFIVAYRMHGPLEDELEEESSGENRSSNSEQTDESEGGGSSGRQQAGASAAMDQAAGALAGAIAGASGAEPVIRGGLDLSAGPQFEVESLYDLVDREVEIPADAEEGIEAETIISPWTSANVLADYPLLYDLFATTEDPTIEGRVNVNQARYEVLIGLPGMTEEIANGILASRMSAGGQPVEEDASRLTTAWLVSEGIVDLPTMRTLDPYLTARGDIFRVQSVGFFDGGGPRARVEAVIDGTVYPAKILQYRDFTELGAGYSPAQLLPQ